jgi:hypothetical protein
VKAIKVKAIKVERSGRKMPARLLVLTLVLSGVGNG